MKLKILVFAFALTLAINLPAQTFATLYNFKGTYGPGGDGGNSVAGLALSSNILYGTTLSGPGEGGVFKIKINGTNFTNVYSFSEGGFNSLGVYINSDGANPEAGLILSDNTLYGTTHQAGSSGFGSIFRVNINGTVFTNLHSFSAIPAPNYTNNDGGFPFAGLILSGNTLYGTTYSGGSFGWGVVFAININGMGFTTLHSFNYFDGANPIAGLILSGNTLYGTTASGGSFGNGTVFAVSTNGMSFTNLHSFSATAGSNSTNRDGANPSAGLIFSGNTLYGTTLSGGGAGYGTVFAVNTNGMSFTNLHSFSATAGSNSTNRDGSGPYAGLILLGNTLYGTTRQGGISGNGTVFKINADGSNFTNLHNFTALNQKTNSDGSSPYGGLILSSNTLYGTTFSGGSFGNGTVFALSLSPSAPIVTVQPHSQTPQAGNNVNLTVVASGVPPPIYQWQLNGQNIPNATNATLTLNSVTAANSGGYSVIVSNPYGSVTSATASLAVLDDGANGNTPTPITASPVPPKQAGVKNLVFITHGWQPSVTEPPTPQWIYDMSNAIQSKVSSDWQVVAYSWIDQAWKADPNWALANAEDIGKQLGQQYAAEGYQYVHLIAHSAGAGMIQEIADQLKSSPNPPAIIQMTFLDPYLGSDLQYRGVFGSGATWSDDYFTPVDETSSPNPFALSDSTGLPLVNAYAVDVSWVGPHQPVLYAGFGGGEIAVSTHEYPVDFYLDSITGGNLSCSSGYGFALSEEMEGAFGNNNQANDPVGTSPVPLCSPLDAVQNPYSQLSGTGESEILGIPVLVGDIASAVSATGASIIGDAGFVLNSITSVLPLVKSGGVQPMGETFTNTPAWLAVGVSVTNAVNFVQFDATFTDTNSAQGLLTVYWNTNQIGMVDERVAETNLQTYRFELPGTVSGGLYTLSFRLDSFNNSSSIAVTNVATGFVGVTQPITLGISFTNGAPLLQLTAATNFTYLVQSSTNLVDWTPTALLLNTNGTAQFMDSAVTNSSARFYRAVMP